jgi:hypothetical protein
VNRRAASTIALVATLLCAVPASARGGDQPRLARVLLLPLGGRVSLVLEMTAAPGSVTSRRVSADLLEVDAAPARVDRAQALTAPAGTPLVSSVVVDGPSPGAAPMLRARITLQGAYESRVRIVGNRVYVDLSSVAETGVLARTPASPRTPARASDATAVAEADPSPERAELDSALSRFEELMPFVTSAANAPSASVLSALTTPLAALADRVQAMPAAGPLRPSEGLLASALSAASRAIDPAYRGDRLEQIRQAESFYQQAKAERDALDAAK